MCCQRVCLGHLLSWVLGGLQNMQAVDVPIYDFSKHQRSASTRRVEPADVVLIEGILVLAMDSLRDFLNMKIFVVSIPSPLHLTFAEGGSFPENCRRIGFFRDATF